MIRSFFALLDVKHIFEQTRLEISIGCMQRTNRIAIEVPGTCTLNL